MRHQAARSERKAEKEGLTRRTASRRGSACRMPGRGACGAFMNQWLALLIGAGKATGKSLAFAVLAGGTGCRRAAAAATLFANLPDAYRIARKKRRTPQHQRGEQVSSISYLPQTFTTLFLLAASLLLGLIR